MKILTLWFCLILSCVYYGRVSSYIYYDYYWRDFTGDIPSDAVRGGISTSLYIGQAYVEQYGIIPVMIYPGQSYVIATVDNIQQVVDKYIKILCSSSRENLKWVSTNSTNFAVQLIDPFVVRGGVEKGLMTYIGRIIYNGTGTIIGKIVEEGRGAKIWYPFASSVYGDDIFDVLVYKTS